MVASSNINIYNRKSSLSGPGGSLQARSPQPGVLSQGSSARLRVPLRVPSLEGSFEGPPKGSLEGYLEGSLEGSLKGSLKGSLEVPSVWKKYCLGSRAGVTFLTCP